MNPREMTPRERQIEKLKDYLLAATIAICIAMVLFYGLSK